MSATPPPLPIRVNRKPILYSALIYPGVGQYMVGRPIAGLAYAACFTVALGVLMVFFSRYFREVFDFMGASWDGNSQPTAGTPSPRQMLMPLVYLMIAYLANLYDIIWHLYRPHLENRAKAGAGLQM